MQQNSLVIPNELLKSIPDYTTAELAVFLRNIMPAMINLFESKDINYNGSWQSRGILSAQSNFERKVDRINAQFYNNTMLSETNENICDTFIDSGLYSLMYLFFLYKKNDNVKRQVDSFLIEFLPKHK